MAYNTSKVFIRIAETGNYSNDDFLEFTKFILHTRFYSLLNTGLIYLQRPDIEYVQTASQWKDYHRFVNNDALPIIMLLPFGPVELLYDIKDTYGDDVNLICRSSFNNYSSSLIKEYPLQSAVCALNNMGIHYCLTNNKDIMSCGARILDSPVKVIRTEADGKETPIMTRYAIAMDDNQSEEIKVKTILHEIGRILCGHIYYDSREKDKKIVKTPWRLYKRPSEDLFNYEAEEVYRFYCKIWGYEDEIFKDKYYNETRNYYKEAYKSQAYVMSAVDILLKYL